MHLEEPIISIINLLVPLIEACGAAIIVIGAIRALWQFIRNRLVIDLSCGPDLRIGLAEYLVLALEFQVAADVLKTAVSPTWEQLGMLAAIIVLRTVLSLLLEREIRELCAEVHFSESDSVGHGRKTGE